MYDLKGVSRKTIGESVQGGAGEVGGGISRKERTLINLRRWIAAGGARWKGLAEGAEKPSSLSSGRRETPPEGESCGCVDWQIREIARRPNQLEKKYLLLQERMERKNAPDQERTLLQEVMGNTLEKVLSSSKRENDLTRGEKGTTRRQASGREGFCGGA